MHDTSLSTQAQRRRAVAMVVALTAGTHLEPLHYERRLLARFEAGELTLTQVDELMATSVHQILYHSRATSPVADADLQRLLESARAHNAKQHITGLLLYSDGYFVQVLEGEESAVNTLFARIQHDPRHHEVATVRSGPGPRRFSDWSMGFGHVVEADLQQVLTAIEVQWPFRVPHVDDPHLLALLDAFA
ncbi:BLUF domain-containing protein [Hymenobacter terricola]|uniref:BLUF domain-containing protein n=1 Tax=Hymenobacter terricola TaxID=2819236 RepID=UPI001B316E1D|nr:BLUF domain-containing protein [Hymenobacter terricola]